MRSLLLLLTLASVTTADERRAKPPVFSQDERDLFPADARKLLVGPRPDFGKMAKPSVVSGGDSAIGPATDYQWSDLISSDALETEIKRQATAVGKLVQSATAFKGGGYRDARDAFNVLALMFAISAEHDEGARWEDSAGGFASLIARAGANCKVGTDGSYREARARGEDLAELVRGGRPDAPDADPDKKWHDYADRSPVMRRMEVAQQERLGQVMGSEREFSRNSENIAHEAQVLAALAEVIVRDEFPDADDEDYVAYAARLREASADLWRAAEQDNYDAARDALGRANKSCTECHGDYRG